MFAKVLIFKKSVHQLDSNPRLPECKLVALPIELYGCGFWWNVAQVFSTSSSSSGCRTQADHRIDLWWQTWRRKMMVFWCYAVDMAMSTIPGKLTAWLTDGQTDGQDFSFIYIDNDFDSINYPCFNFFVFVTIFAISTKSLIEMQCLGNSRTDFQLHSISCLPRERDNIFVSFFVNNYW